MDWSDVYAALREIMRCEKRVANFIIRTCFHESGNVQPASVRGGKGSGANNSGFCSSEHRRVENTGHSFFDHSMAIVAAVANETGASTMDTLAMACMVAYEVTAGDVATDSVELLRMGRCDKVSDPVAAQVPDDPPNVLPSPFASTDVAMQFWQAQGFAPAEAAALLATHTLVQGKAVNMHYFDLEFVHVFAQNWPALGFNCAIGKQQGATAAASAAAAAASTTVVNLEVANGNVEIAGFTSDLGRNNHLDIGILYPPVGDLPFTESRCACFDPQFGGSASQRAGGWPFTQNDCSTWLTCNDIIHGNNVTAYNAYTRSYCEAFVVFSESPDMLWSTLTQATARLLSRGIFTPNSFKPAFYIDYKAIRNAQHASFSVSINDDSNNPYGRLCNANAKTPCSTTVPGGCNTYPSDKSTNCSSKGLNEVFHCLTKNVIRSKAYFNGKWYYNNAEAEKENSNDDDDNAAAAAARPSSSSTAVTVVIAACVAAAVVVIIVLLGVVSYKRRRHTALMHLKAAAEMTVVTAAAAAGERKGSISSSSSNKSVESSL